MQRDIIYLPKVDKEYISLSHNYVVAPGKIKSKMVRWLMQKAFDFMFKNGFLQHDSYVQQHTNMETVELDLSRLDEQIAMQKDIIEAVYYRRIDTLIVGADIMKKMMRRPHNPYDMDQIHFQMSMESKFAVYSGRDAVWAPKYERVMYRGLNIVLVPWFKGFLPLETKGR